SDGGIHALLQLAAYGRSGLVSPRRLLPPIHASAGIFVGQGRSAAQVRQPSVRLRLQFLVLRAVQWNVVFGAFHRQSESAFVLVFLHWPLALVPVPGDSLRPARSSYQTPARSGGALHSWTVGGYLVQSALCRANFRRADHRVRSGHSTFAALDSPSPPLRH